MQFGLRFKLAGYLIFACPPKLYAAAEGPPEYQTLRSLIARGLKWRWNFLFVSGGDFASSGCSRIKYRKEEIKFHAFQCLRMETSKFSTPMATASMSATSTARVSMSTTTIPTGTTTTTCASVSSGTSVSTAKSSTWRILFNFP